MISGQREAGDEPCEKAHGHSLGSIGALFKPVIPLQRLLADGRDYHAVECVGRALLLRLLRDEFGTVGVETIDFGLELLALHRLGFDVGFAFHLRHLLHLDGTVTITGVKELHGAEHEVIPDRIEAATFAIAAAATNGEVRIKGARADHLHAVLDKLREAGVKIERSGPDLVVKRGSRLKPVDITTLPYSGFPTDVQAQMMALMALTPGISIITERIFESRFMHVPEMARLGADISIEGPSAIVKGGRPLSGAPVMASDLRASAALVIAGMTAKGATQVNRIYHLDRGYEKIDLKLKSLGARIERVEGE